MIGQNRQAAFQQAKADHDFVEEDQELKLNTELTREIHDLTRELHTRILGDQDVAVKAARGPCRVGESTGRATGQMTEARPTSRSLLSNCVGTLTQGGPRVGASLTCSDQSTRRTP
jgi:hypothetical protein